MVVATPGANPLTLAAEGVISMVVLSSVATTKKNEFELLFSLDCCVKFTE